MMKRKLLISAMICAICVGGCLYTGTMESALAMEEPGVETPGAEEEPGVETPGAENPAVETPSEEIVAVDGVYTLKADAVSESAIADTVKKATTGEVVRFEGNFTISQTLKVANSGVTLDFSKATITCKSQILLINLYKLSDITIKGGSFFLGDNTMAIKMSGCSNITVDGIDVTGGGDTNETTPGQKDGAIYIFNSKNVKLINSSLMDCNDKPVYVSESDDVTIANNTIDNIFGYGIHVRIASNPIIVNNKITNITGDGITLTLANNGVVTGNTIENVIYHPQLDFDSVRKTYRSGCGIMMSKDKGTQLGGAYKYDGTTYTGNVIKATENYSISLNLCHTTTMDGLSLSESGNNSVHCSASASTTIKNCTISGASECGISIVAGPGESTEKEYKSSANTIIADNTVTDSAKHAIWIHYTEGTKVVGNTISKSKVYGIRCDNSTGTKISGNTIDSGLNTKNSGISITVCESVNIGGKIAVLGKNYIGNIVNNQGKYGIIADNSKKISVLNNKINDTKDHAMRFSKCPNISIKSNKVNVDGNCGLYIEKSKKPTISKNTITDSKKNPIMIKSCSGCKVKSVSMAIVDKITKSTKNITGKATPDVTVKFKIGKKTYTCTRKGYSFTSKPVSKLKKGTKVYMYQSAGGGNTVVTTMKVK